MARDPHESQRWRHPERGISALARKYNPLCQWVDSATGQQCQKPSSVVHHITDWKVDPTVFFSWNNIVCLCSDHHSGGTLGETMGNLYAHTIGPLDSVYPQSARMFPCWHDDFKPRPNPQSEPAGFLPPGSTASSVGDDILDRALAAEI